MQSAVMAVQDSHPVSLDLSQIMDVVTLYKCKFCDFSCQQPQGISDHVQQTHTISQLKPQMKHKVREIIEMGTSESGDGDGKIQLQEVSRITFDAGTQADPVESSLSHSAESSLLHSHDVDTSIPHSMLDDTQDMQDVNSDIDAVDRIIEAANVDSGLDVGDDTQTSIAFNKEIYLCGQCNLGFDSMENCKNHMIRDHNVSVEQEPTVSEGSTAGHPPTEVSLPVNRVSVGTQVSTGKKPGRKRKFKPDPKPQMSVEEEYEEEMAKQERVRQAQETLAKERAEAESKGEPQEGEDGEPAVDQSTDSVDSETGAGRRRRRLPVRLASLYYMGNRSPSHTTTSTTTRQQPPRTRIKVEPHKLRCLKAVCNAKFRTQSSLDLHMACHTTVEEWGGRKDVFSCPRCDAADPLWKVLRMHLWKVHLVDTDLYSCDKCGFKVDSVFRLERHMQIHGDTRPYVCEVCEKGFKQASQLQNHKAVHADRAEPNKWYSNKVCEICKRTFANQKSLKIHIESIHSKERPFVCPYCNHATSRKAILDLHVRTHTGEKPFKCDMCTYVTGDHNSLRRHKMRHTGEKPYKCRYCPYSAIQAISLKTHMKNKHPGYEGIFACNLCQYQTVNEQYYNQHQIDHENGLVPTVRSTPQAGEVAATVQAVAVRPARAGESLIRPGPSQQQQQQQTEVQPRLITLQDGRQALAIHAPNIAHRQTTPTAIINQADLAKLTNMGVLQDGTDAAQLIYTALNALSQNQSGTSQNGGQLQTGQQVLLSGAQPTVQSTTHEGVTTHTITFHIPPTEEQEAVGEHTEETVISTTTMEQPQIVEEHAQLVQVEEHAQLVQVEEHAPAQLIQVEEDGQMVYRVQGGGGQQHIIVNETGEVTYTTEVGPEETGHPEEQHSVQEISHEIEDTGQAVDALSEQLVLEISPSETLTETIEVSAYEATPTEATHTETVVVDSTIDPTEAQTTEEMSTMVANAIEIMPQVSSGEVATMVMEVMDEDGNIQETQVEYVTCAIGEEN